LGHISPSIPLVVPVSALSHPRGPLSYFFTPKHDPSSVGGFDPGNTSGFFSMSLHFASMSLSTPSIPLAPDSSIAPNWIDVRVDISPKEQNSPT